MFLRELYKDYENPILNQTFIRNSLIKKMVETKTLLAVGDWKDFDTFRKFCKSRRFFYNSGISLKKTDYWKLLGGDLPKLNTQELIVFLFFPFEYWDKHIEPKQYKGIYGNKAFYEKFRSFWKDVKKSLDSFYKDKKISYINPPESLATDRDKELTKEIVSRSGILVPKRFHNNKVGGVIGLLDKGYKLFIKVRFGSMGKGITYLEKGRWMTNFRFRNGRIVNKHSDYGWSFIDITANKKFLSRLLRKDIIIEEAINPLLIRGRKFDLRMYVFRDSVLYSYGRSNDAEAVTTNISQGAKGEKTSFIRLLPKRQLEAAKKAAVKAIKSLGLGFGGVDMMLCADRKSAMFIEINTFPGFPRARRFNLSRFLIKEIIREYGN
ncbi:hypothetical protein GF323_03705 [Candidatus Woesearchaeota archaeon]|nr:hypothetical protein [Candidatus Woesearchaeota archaeon]